PTVWIMSRELDKNECGWLGFPTVLVQKELVAGALFVSSTILLVRPANQIAVVPEVGRISAEDGVERWRDENGLIRRSPAQNELLDPPLFSVARVEEQNGDQHCRHVEYRAPEEYRLPSFANRVEHFGRKHRKQRK